MIIYSRFVDIEWLGPLFISQIHSPNIAGYIFPVFFGTVSFVKFHDNSVTLSIFCCNTSKESHKFLTSQVVQDFSHQQYHRGPWCSNTFILFEKDLLPSHFPWKVWVILCLLQATSSDYVVNDLACAYVPMEADHTLMSNLIQWIWYHHMKQLVVWIKAVRRCKVVARPHCETMIPSDDTMKSLQSWRQNILKTAKTMQVKFSLYSLQSGPSSYSVNVEERVKESFFFVAAAPLD